MRSWDKRGRVQTATRAQWVGTIDAAHFHDLHTLCIPSISENINEVGSKYSSRSKELELETSDLRLDIQEDCISYIVRHLVDHSLIYYYFMV